MLHDLLKDESAVEGMPMRIFVTVVVFADIAAEDAAGYCRRANQ